MVHEMFSERSLVQLKERHPQAKVLAHPECPEAVLRHADYVGSTTGISQDAEQSPATEFIVATEKGILHQMEKACPEKTFISAPGEGGCQCEGGACSECPHMKLNSMEKLYLCMKIARRKSLWTKILRKRALRPIQRMLEMS
jgi:quinolinate synthase